MHTVVTGATGALGRDVVGLLAENGHKVTGIGRADSIEVEGLYQAIGGIDLGDAERVASAIAQAAESAGPIDGLVNIAGGFAWETVADGSVETWDRMYEMNVRTALNACRAALPHLNSPGAIINTGAGAAAKAGLGMGAYAAAKSGVASLTESLAEELKGKGTRVNAILPSIIDTPTNRKDMPDADFASWVTAREIANVIRFLLSAEASGVTGALIPVSGRV